MKNHGDKNDNVDAATKEAARQYQLQQARDLMIAHGYRETFPGSDQWIPIAQDTLDQIDNKDGGPETPETN